MTNRNSSRSAAAMRAMRLIFTLFLCTSLTAVLTAAGTARVRPGVAELTATRSPVARTTAWMVFRAPDCGLSAEFIEELNRIDASQSVEVVGVMLFPPADSAGQVAMTKFLGMKFKMVYDVDRVWSGAMQRGKQRSPVLYLHDGVSLLGGISPQFVRQFAAFALADVPMERER